ncbi:hypothetical protein D3C75_989140 [compost metagenome]
MGRKRKISFDVLRGRNGNASGDFAYQRNLLDGMGEHLQTFFASQYFDGSGFGRVPADHALLLQPLQMSVNGGAGCQAYGFANLPYGGRITFIADFIFDKFEDRLLPIGNPAHSDHSSMEIIIKIITQNRSSHKHKFECCFCEHLFVFVDTNVCSCYAHSRTNVWE